MNAVHGQRPQMAVPDLSAKPDRLFDREDEWSTLIAFSSDPHAGTRLGAVVGRPRQGKTLLLESVARATGGFYFCGQEATEAESLRRLGEEYARYRQVAPPSHWRDWKEAIDALLALGDSRALPVIIDSFPDLVAASPALTSVIHGALRRLERPPQVNRARLILGGSTAPVMNRLFAPSSQLEAVSGLKLDLQPLDFRKAAQLWGIDDPELAFRVYAVVGGTPAYRHDYVGGDVPVDRNDFDAWVCRTVLNPRTPLFREARHLVDEETGHQSPGACHSVLAALAAGCATQGEIAAFLGQQLSDASRASPFSERTAYFGWSTMDCGRPSYVTGPPTSSWRSSMPWRARAGPRWNKAPPKRCGKRREPISTPLSRLPSSLRHAGTGWSTSPPRIPSAPTT
ncbi:hypothetical protein EES37_17810 [Streptomyces sp. ADI91-18]|uniref:AAA family ATPase n=1 Tax=Streptomyces sp. ADI91-18 TaxID=1522755 RepID=UPI000F907BA0|nr:hypothetical protein [Streptomyces sp. ADI91-18]RPK43042.1 hypothetical protein EES37_17810 [Streptomyces sp. ADI91-18]